MLWYFLQKYNTSNTCDANHIHAKYHVYHAIMQGGTNRRRYTESEETVIFHVSCQINPLTADQLFDMIMMIVYFLTKIPYRHIYHISRTKSQTLNVSYLVLKLSLSNPLKPGMKLRMKM